MARRVSRSSTTAADPAEGASTCSNDLPRHAGGVFSIKNNTSANARRRLRRHLLQFEKKVRRRGEEIYLADAISVVVEAYGVEAKDVSCVVDSGTTTIMVRDKENFVSVSKVSVRIKGVGGSSIGYKGVLKECVLGVGLPAVYFPALPVECLLSVEGLKSLGWETLFLLEQNILQHRVTGTVLSMTKKNGSKLPCIDLNFGSEDSAYTCYPCEEAALQAEEDELPPRLKKGAKRAQKKKKMKKTKKEGEKREKPEFARREGKVVEKPEFGFFDQNGGNPETPALAEGETGSAFGERSGFAAQGKNPSTSEDDKGHDGLP